MKYHLILLTDGVPESVPNDQIAELKTLYLAALKETWFIKFGEEPSWQIDKMADQICAEIKKYNSDLNVTLVLSGVLNTNP